MTDWTDLQEYVGATTDADLAQAKDAWQTAVALVTNHIGAASVPMVISDRAVLEVGSELFHRKNAPNGVSQFNTFDAAPIRVARDPMVAAYPLLAPFLGPVIA